MTPERHARIGDLYHQAVSQPAERRAAFLAATCADDDALQQEVASLLAAHDAAHEFIEAPAIATLARTLSAHARSFTHGTRLGPYEVRALLGRGGMGEVYRAHDARLGRDVALKLLPANYARDAQRLARFAREARLLAALNHPNIAALYGLEENGGQPILVLELVQGQTLEEQLAAGPMPWPAALAIAAQIVEALDAAHGHGIIHRDLKPANIVVRADGVVKVLDFGLARSLHASESGDASPEIVGEALDSHIVIGTAPYMSPEQARGTAADERVDIWAFGCVLFEMLTGRRAFDGGNVTEVLSGVLHHEPEWTRLPADVPCALHRLLRLCMDREPARRPQSCRELRHDLQGLLQAAGSPGQESPRLLHARTTWGTVLAALTVALIAGLVAARLTRIAAVDTPLAVPVPLTAYPGFEQDPSLSRDGSRVAFAWNGPSLDNYDIPRDRVASDSRDTARGARHTTVGPAVLGRRRRLTRRWPSPAVLARSEDRRYRPGAEHRAPATGARLRPSGARGRTAPARPSCPRHRRVALETTTDTPAIHPDPAPRSRAAPIRRRRGCQSTVD